MQNFPRHCSFTYLLFAINLWHRKFVTTDVTAAFFNNQHGIQRRGQDFDKKFVFQGLHSKEVDRRNPAKSWTKCDVNNLLKNFRATRRYHTTTSSSQSQPHFIEENNYAFVCLNIANILLTHKYTTSYTLHTRGGIKIGALKMQFVCIFFHIC